MSIASTEGRNVAQIPIHQEARILEARVDIVQEYRVRPSDSDSNGYSQCFQLLIVRGDRERCSRAFIEVQGRDVNKLLKAVRPA